MPLIVLPDIAGSAKPELDDVRDAERAIVEATGGVHEALRHPGGLDADNFAADPGFTNRQKVEGLARVALASGTSAPLGDAQYGYTGEGAWSHAIVVSSLRVQCDTVHIWHTNADPLIGVIDVLIDGVTRTQIVLPAEGLAKGVVHEAAFPFLLPDLSVVDFFGIEGTDRMKTLAAGAAPGQTAMFFATIYGTVQHVR